MCKELAQLNDFNPNAIKGINWRCTTNRMKQYCHRVHLKQTPWTLDATIKCIHIMAHKLAKKSKEFGFHHYQQCLPHVLDEGETNLYKIQEDIVAKFEGREIIEKNTC